jgi:hypothetical protein
MLAPVPTCARECRFVRGDFVGNHAADPDLWEFCGAGDAQLNEVPRRLERPHRAMPTARCAGQDLIAMRGSALPSVPAESCMLSRITGTRRPTDGMPGIYANGSPVTALPSPRAFR